MKVNILWRCRSCGGEGIMEVRPLQLGTPQNEVAQVLCGGIVETSRVAGLVEKKGCSGTRFNSCADELHAAKIHPKRCSLLQAVC
jgi:hypothetical protein